MGGTAATLSIWLRSGMLLGLAGPLLLAGVFRVEPDLPELCYWSGSWIYPVGDPHELDLSMPGAPAYRVRRNIGERPSHQGVDLSNLEAGGMVRAAAHGLVVKAADRGWGSGYGRHVVLAHRSPDGSLVYSVYAHLAPKSLLVRPGDLVAAGEPLGRVGMSGRATSPHLHFEVRRPDRLEERWEKAEVIDPVAFVQARLAGSRSDSTWARPYLIWAENSALLRPELEASPLRRDEWWRMLAAAVRHPLPAIPDDPEALRDALGACGILDRVEQAAPQGMPSWGEVSRDLDRASRRGLRLPPCPVDPTARHASCQKALGIESPAGDLMSLAKRRGRPGRVEMCLVLADLAAAGGLPVTPASVSD